MNHFYQKKNLDGEILRFPSNCILGEIVFTFLLKINSYVLVLSLAILCDHIIDRNHIDIMTFSIWSKLFKRELIIKSYQKVPDSQSYVEDMLALLACVMESDSIYMKKKAYYHYVYRNSSMTNENWIKIMRSLGTLHICIQNLLKEYDTYDKLSSQIEQWLQMQIINNMLTHF